MALDRRYVTDVITELVFCKGWCYIRNYYAIMEMVLDQKFVQWK